MERPKVCVRLNTSPNYKGDVAWVEHMLTRAKQQRGYRLRELARHGWSLESSAGELGSSVDDVLASARKWFALKQEAAAAGFSVDEYLMRARLVVSDRVAFVAPIATASPTVPAAIAAHAAPAGLVEAPPITVVIDPAADGNRDQLLDGWSF